MHDSQTAAPETTGQDRQYAGPEAILSWCAGRTTPTGGTPATMAGWGIWIAAPAEERPAH